MRLTHLLLAANALPIIVVSALPSSNPWVNLCCLVVEALWTAYRGTGFPLLPPALPEQWTALQYRVKLWESTLAYYGCLEISVNANVEKWPSVNAVSFLFLLLPNPLSFGACARALTPFLFLILSFSHSGSLHISRSFLLGVVSSLADCMFCDLIE